MTMTLVQMQEKVKALEDERELHAWSTRGKAVLTTMMEKIEVEIEKLQVVDEIVEASIVEDVESIL